MTQFIQRIPFLVELFINGTFILLYSLSKSEKLPTNWDSNLVEQIIGYWAWIVPFVLFLAVMANYISSRSFEEFLRKYIFSLVVFIPMAITWGDPEFAFWLASVHLLSSVLSLYEGGGQGSFSKKPTDIGVKVVNGIRLRPAQLVLVSFAGTIFLGAFLLMLPVSAPAGKSIGFIDAVFMSTSATCVTGLSTISTGNDLSLFGQIVILTLIQIGGLSIMTLYSSMAILLGRSMGMKDRMIMQDLLEASSAEELFAMIVSIIKYTFLIELWGGIVLTFGFSMEGFEFGEAIYYGFFHSISAFCNAGFSLFDTSLESYATKPLIHGTIAVLVTLGGLGFIVLKELKEVAINRKKIIRLGLHTKIVLVTSFILTASGAVFIFFGEFLTGLDKYTLWEKTQIALFQSITLRTAGFNTVPLTSLNSYTLYAMTLLMFIGGSPGSTAGGIKTTTLAVLIESIISTLRADKTVGIHDRSIPSPIVVRTIALTFISILIASFFILVMVKFETDQEFLPIYFEVISSLGTVGLSLGITPFLTFAGKAALSALMLIGRIGPLTLILAIAQRNRARGKIVYPTGRIMIG